MLMAGAGDAWGQNDFYSVKADHTIMDVLYVDPGEPKTVSFQETGESTGMDGYVRWYVIDKDNNTVEIDDRLEPTVNYNSKLTQYGNSYGWYATNNNQKLGNAASISCTFSAEDIRNGMKLVYEVSSVAADRTQSGNGTLVPLVIGVRHVYELRNANERATLLKTKLTEFESLGIKENSNDLTPLRKEQGKESNYVLNAYDIYMPKGKASNFRLPEDLDNYYIQDDNENTVKATEIRWKINTSNDGINWDTRSPYTGNQPNQNNPDVKYSTKTNNIINYEFTTNVKKACILAEVRGGNSTQTYTDWYPVSFLNVTMVDDSGITEDDLEANTTLYKRLARISFETEDEILYNNEQNIVNLLTNDPLKNVKTEVFTTEIEGEEREVESYYAFAHPEMYQYRYGNDLKVMKGEYALYRTLNYPNISYSTEGHGRNDPNLPTIRYNREDGEYSDYFPAQYDQWVTDRLWEKENGQQSGYFMYVDASETPGVITKIPISGLCPNTSLIVNAWVCDVTSGTGRTPANIGFTLKGKGENNTETILAKYYSGAIGTKDNGDFAAWQRVSFKFSFSKTDIKDTDNFILEISSNCESSNGADFGIDDISVYSTLPAITAQREDACDASVLMVSTDYQTLQSNMTWDISSDVIDKDQLQDFNYRKYRYGLMGNDPYAAVDDIMHPNIGNVYFAFTEIQENGDVGNWISVNKDLVDHTHDDELVKPEEDTEVLNRLQYVMRVAAQTDMKKYTDGDGRLWVPKTQEEAKKLEITMNVHAMNDFLEDLKRNSDLNERFKNDPHVEDLENIISNLCKRDGSTSTDAATIGNPLLVTEVYVDKIMNPTSTEYATYEKAARDLFICLGIPRIRCPWRSGDNAMLYLSEIDVHNTDLRFAGEIYKDEDGNTVEPSASGRYYVVLFSAKQIAESEDPNKPSEPTDPDAPAVEDVLGLNTPCALKKVIYVSPSITIKVDTETSATGVTCEGSIHTLNANLMVTPVDKVGNVTGEEMVDFDTWYEKEEYKYTFDWYLGSEKEANERVENTGHNTLQALLKAFRDGLGNTAEEKVANFTVEDVEKSKAIDDDAKAILKDLIGSSTEEPKLVFGKSPSFRWVAKVTAMPYVGSDGNDLDLPAEGETKKLFCTEPQELELAAESNVPTLNVGFGNIDYPKDIPLNTVPLRLGLAHIENKTTLTVPIQKEITFGMPEQSDNEEDASMKYVLKALENNKNVYLRDYNTYQVIGTLNSLIAQQDNKNNSLSLTFTLEEKDIPTYFKEGGIYDLYFPFGEYQYASTEDIEDAELIPNSCEGYAYLRIKIVPEYLTWSPSKDNPVWYNDKNWYASTKDELYSDQIGVGETKTNQLSPLYFTKVTVLEDEELALEDDEELTEKDNGVLKITDSNSTIQYDMAVNNTGENGAIVVKPYYINRVDQIYFKPKATLMNQHFLDYQTARVEFEMKESQPYWQSSPLYDVYAGDMYAPKQVGNDLSTAGKQVTPAFEDITYNQTGVTNSRWNPAFYQKAWDKSVAYQDHENKTGSANAVKSNWSIEYNDVWVPYALGTGFYARVEEQNVLVRLPKADKTYNYEEAEPQTRAGLSPAPTSREKYGKMADKAAVEVTFTPEKDSDGNHFLVGNPYMTYLNMEEFFKQNSSLNRKYWIIDTESNTTQAIVGTPDIPWTGATENGNNMTGLILPMTAFFVERAGYNEGEEKPEETQAEEEETNKEEVKITFTTDMMAAKPSAKATPSTRSHAATAPVLTLTAERDGQKGRSVITLRDNADNAYQPQEDAVVLLDSELDAPVAYSVAGNRTAQVNALRSIDNIPVGVYNSRKGDVSLTIEGISQLAEPLYLYDSYTRSSTLLEGDSYTLDLSGESHGRYYLRSSATGSIDTNAIAIYSVKNGKVIVSSTEEVRNIKVYSLNGSLVKEMKVNTTQHTFNLPKGIYIVRAKGNADAVKTEKVMVR